ncbi:MULTISPECIES: FlgO family outer membrane protein [unclassified Endozoicomonas]|uniref:FlgO family outer membrane protein n=1 Tax=unclassified Endozoicomonas TaxID=2644528 RepID=UPI0021472145|nr:MULTISPECIES: FlgO family outer membrane protein [unclassified Endozoicomonas]
MKAILIRLSILLVSLFLAACESQPVYEEPPRIDLVGISKIAAATLHSKASDLLPEGSTILSTSLADIDSLSATSTLGRILSEQLSSRLSDRGYELIEIKMRNSVFISNERGGEFTLSRQLAAISKDYNADAILTGTYALGSQTVYINARLINTVDNIVLSTVDFQLPIDSDIRMMTKKSY